jgi:hypothetical protein
MRQSRRSRGRRLAVALAASLAALALAGTATAAPPQPCVDGLRITDAAQDGHHAGTDILSAWLAEEGGQLKAVIRVRADQPRAEHDDEEISEAGFVFVFTTGGTTWYVRAVNPYNDDSTFTYDYGTYTPIVPGSFVPGGPTSGQLNPNIAGGGSVTIDIPIEEIEIEPGALLTSTFVLTYDGISGGNHHWVDHAPGHISPTDAARGPTYVFGKCVGVELKTPGKRIGPGKVVVSGRVVGATEAVEVTISRWTRGAPVEVTVWTDDEGTFSRPFTVKETTSFRAEAELPAIEEPLVSQQRTVVMRSTAKITSAKRKANGVVVVKGVTAPKLPGRLLLLNTNAVKPAAKKATFKGGKFAFKKKLKPGRYLVVYVPRNDRAERSASKAVRVR